MLLLLIPLGVLLVGLVGTLLDLRLGVDSAVYRSGALTLLNGEPLYEFSTLGPEPWWALLPFTYPPTAALLFVPLAAMPTQLAWGFVAAVSVLLLSLVIRVTIATLGERRWASPAKATVVFSIALLALEPVWRTLFLGQINVILMAIVVLDVLVIGSSGPRLRRWGGVLVGVAAAVKLTPLIFVAHLWFIGRRADAARAGLTFVLLQGLLFAVVPGDSRDFWGHAVSDPGRTGPIHWAGNQSLNGLVSRLSGLAPWSLYAAVGVGLVLAVPAVWLMLRFHRQGLALPALLVTAFYGLLVSPVSWSHHWVWVVPLIVLLAARVPRGVSLPQWRQWAPPAGVILVYASGVLLWMSNGHDVELFWSPLQFVPGSAYLIVPVVIGTVLTVSGLRGKRAA
ncbi:MAG: DUF2029 domain-containing protein [Pseudonocardiaceae bacterium]|nr:DUF2029 domain-containing protein [Pseudonocardiaceae bacterium]